MARRPALPEGTDAVRLCDGEGDGLPGIFIDSFSGHWLVQTQDTEWPEWLDASQTSLGWLSLWWKPLDRHQKESPRPVAGECARVITAHELGLRYRIDFGAGYSQGLFIDQFEQKKEVAGMLRVGDRFLNLFAYTCAFSVVAAHAGAVVTSVDLSRPFLDWGQVNFQLNDLDPSGHFFCRGDTASWLKRFASKGRTWHGIVLDPPTFSRDDDGKVFRVEKDLGDLVAGCLRVLEPGGWLMVSTNHRGLSWAAFTSLLEAGCALAERPLARLQRGSMPPGFTGPSYLKAAWLFTE